MRQVTHALLTRPPLSHKTFQPEGIKVRRFVRLACVRHAASVHPEPGSNSHVKVLSSFRTTLGCSSRYYCFRFVSFSETSYLLKNFRGLVHCLVIIVPVVFLICFISDNFYILSLSKKFVNNFFHFSLNLFSRFFSGALGVNTGNPCRFKVFAAVFSAANINIPYPFQSVNKFFKVFLHFSTCFSFRKKWKRLPLPNGERGI